MKRRSAKQIAASRRNLAIARASRWTRTSKGHRAARANLYAARYNKHKKGIKRAAGGILAVGVGAAAIYGGSKVSGHPVNVKNYSPPKAKAAVNTRVRSSAFKRANYPHTQEAKRVAQRRYKHTNTRVRTIGEAEALRRTGTYVGYREIKGRKVTARERSSALGKYRKQTI